MGLAFDTEQHVAGVGTRRAGAMFRNAGTILNDGFLVIGTVTLFAGTAIFRYGWDAMTNSGQSFMWLLDFVGLYLFGAFVLATAWMFGHRLADREAKLEQRWMQGYLTAVTLLIAVIALVPPIRD